MQLTLPSGSPAVASSALTSAEGAEKTAQRLRAAGYPARAEAVSSDQLDDAGGYLGDRVRVGSFATRAEADAISAELGAQGYTSGSWYTGWDGDAEGLSTAGPVDVEVLTIDPRRFRGEVDASFGPDLHDTETTSELGTGALAAVNGGFFVFGPQHGAPGDPAGAGAYDGRVLSETVGDRPSLIIDSQSGRAQIQRLRWSGRISAGSAGLDLDGINRVPGLIRNCGGTDDQPTEAPLHDVTCTDDGELVAFTADFGTTTPSGAGAEIVLDRSGAVRAVHKTRGTELRDGERSIQATGDSVDPLLDLADAGARLKLKNDYLQENGHRLPMTPHTQVINGGPMLMADGRVHVSAARDGMVQPASPGAFYGWSHQRNPRTIAGIDAQGRLVLVTVDGRQTSSVGMSLSESAQLAEDLGLVEAINFDGGGSTTMVVGGEVANAVSGATERPVGDAIVIRGR